MNSNTIAIVKSTAPLIEEVGVEITKHFYGLLFEENPQLKNVFNMASQANGRQQNTLAASILSYAANIDRLEALGPEVGRIAAKHFSLDVAAEQYPIVGRNLLKAIRAVLGEEVATDEVIAAWGEAYQVLADILINAEQSLYDDASNQQGGWSGFKAFKVMRVVEESSEIRSFYLQPEDGQPLPDYKPGQFISVKIESDELEFTEIRQYSLSEAPGTDLFRISVKKEVTTDAPNGLVSNYLHRSVTEGDTLQVHAPGGDFYLNSSETPVVLISGGVGITPMLSMLNDIVKRRDSRPVVWIHGTRGKETHVFSKHVRNLAGELPQLTSLVCYENADGAVQGEDYDRLGYIDTALLTEYCPDNADIYFCGPQLFMESIYRQLKQLNFSEEQINYEVFGPGQTLQ